MTICRLECHYCSRNFYVKDCDVHRYKAHEEYCCISCHNDHLGMSFQDSLDEKEIKDFWKKSKNNKLKYMIQRLTERVEELEARK